MKSLLLVAHGSRRMESNNEINTVTQKLRAKVQDQYTHIEYAFLELAQPSIPAAIENLIQAGSTEIMVLPYFLSAGRHVHKDIPEIIQAKQEEHTHVQFTMAPYLGSANEVIDVLAGLSSS